MPAYISLGIENSLRTTRARIPRAKLSATGDRRLARRMSVMGGGPKVRALPAGGRARRLARP